MASVAGGKATVSGLEGASVSTASALLCSSSTVSTTAFLSQVFRLYSGMTVSCWVLSASAAAAGKGRDSRTIVITSIAERKRVILGLLSLLKTLINKFT